MTENKSYTLRLFLIVVLPMLLARCTDNPFESEALVDGSDRRVLGSVRLSDSDDHSGVYVWLEGFDLATRTTADGTFSFTLPPPAAQAGGSGADGAYRVWTFVGNYALRSFPTAVRGGRFVFPSTEIDAQGALREPLYLQQQFSITTVLSMTRIEADSPRFISMQVELRTPGAPVDVYFPRMYDGVEGPVFLRNIRTGEVQLYSTTVTGIEINDYVRIADVPYVRSMLLNIPANALRAGQYEVVPYLLPRGVSIPVPLLNSLGEDVTALNPSYLSYPFRREGGKLDVTPN